MHACVSVCAHVYVCLLMSLHVIACGMDAPFACMVSPVCFLDVVVQDVCWGSWGVCTLAVHCHFAPLQFRLEARWPFRRPANSLAGALGGTPWRFICHFARRNTRRYGASSATSLGGTLGVPLGVMPAAHSKGGPTCVMYIRTSSAANIGDEKDSEPRQREACKRLAWRRCWKVAAEFRDPAVSGTDALICRKGFADCAEYCLKHKIEYIIVESGDRFARNLVVQETALEWLGELGLEVISAENETQFTEPSAVPQNTAIIFSACVRPLPEGTGYPKLHRIPPQSPPGFCQALHRMSHLLLDSCHAGVVIVCVQRT